MVKHIVAPRNTHAPASLAATESSIVYITNKWKHRLYREPEFCFSFLKEELRLGHPSLIDRQSKSLCGSIVSEENPPQSAFASSSSSSWDRNKTSCPVARLMMAHSHNPWHSRLWIGTLAKTKKNFEFFNIKLFRLFFFCFQLKTKNLRQKKKKFIFLSFYFLEFCRA